MDQEINANEQSQGAEITEFNVACPKCGVVFAVPVEYAGEMAECSECDAVFQIPSADTQHEENQKQTDANAEDAENGNSHSTVKLSRSTIGMIPSLKDNFEIGTKNVPLQNS